MEVKANNNLDAAHRVTVGPIKRRQLAPESDTTSFYRVEALNQALQATPVVRPEAVAKARALIGDVKYPAEETIDGIASLLGLKLEVASGE